MSVYYGKTDLTGSQVIASVQNNGTPKFTTTQSLVPRNDRRDLMSVINFKDLGIERLTWISLVIPDIQNSFSKWKEKVSESEKKIQQY